MVYLGIVLQSIALGIMIWKLRQYIIANIGGVFVIVAFIYHGVTEIVQGIFPGYNEYRLLVSQRAIAEWAVIAGISLTLFSAAYVIARGPVRSGSMDRSQEFAKVLPPVLPTVVVTVVTLLTVLSAQQGVGSYFVAGLADQFVLPLIALFGVVVFLRGRMNLIAIMALLVVMASLIGSRLNIAAVPLAAVAGIYLIRGHLAGRSLLAMVSLSALGFLALTGARESMGRESILAGSAWDRVGAFISGAFELEWEDFLESFVYRFDGNTWGALLTTAYRQGAPGTGIEPLGNTFWLAIPQFINPNKLLTDLTQRSEEYFMIVHFGLLDIDYLPMTLGIAYGYSGLPGLLIIAALLGAFLGKLDAWLHKKPNVATLPIFLSLTISTVLMEKGISTYVIQMRGLIVLVAILWGIVLLKNSFAAKTAIQQWNIHGRQSSTETKIGL